MSMVTGQDNVVRVMVAIGTGARAKLIEVMTLASLDIQQDVKVNKLSGQVLNRRTGRLRNSINQAVIADTSSVSAVVGTGVVYARAHEYGFQGTANVPSHTRTQTMAFGKPIAARMVQVRAHPMRMNLPERSFLRSSLREKAPVEIERIRKSMAELIQESQR